MEKKEKLCSICNQRPRFRKNGGYCYECGKLIVNINTKKRRGMTGEMLQRYQRELNTAQILYDDPYMPSADIARAVWAREGK